MSAPHPSPQRDRVAPGLLMLALASGPGGWIAQLIVDYALSAQLCGARRLAGAPSGARYDGQTAVLLGVSLLCLAIVVAGGMFCRRVWNRVADEKSGGADDALSIGEGRTRFLAVCGMLSAVGFTIAVAFNTVEPLLLPACWTGAP